MRPKESQSDVEPDVARLAVKINQPSPALLGDEARRVRMEAMRTMTSGLQIRSVMGQQSSRVV
jgi:hypothetical protein